MIPQIRANYIETGKAKLIFNEFAWIGEESRQATQAAQCAGAQGKYWQYHDHLFNNQNGENRGGFAAANLKRFATEVGLDTAAFNTCLDRGALIEKIRAKVTEFRSKGVNSTPTVLVNGQRVTPNFEAVSAAVEAALR